MSESRSRSAKPAPAYVAIACWLDLLGYGGDIDDAGFDPGHPLAKAPLGRLRAFQRVVSEHSGPGFPTLVINDGAVAYSNVDPSRSDNVWRFISRCWELYQAASKVDRASGGPGLRGVIAVGLRAKGSNRGIVAQDDAMASIIEQLVAGDIDGKKAKADAGKVRRVFDISPQLQANFAFTRAYEAEQSGSAAGLPGPALYLDTAVFTHDVPHWIRSGPPIPWTPSKTSLATSFIALDEIEPVAPAAAHAGLRSGDELRSILQGRQPARVAANEDPCLYKYTSFDTARIVLASGRLRWTTPPLLNDPYDLGFDLHLDYRHDSVREAAIDLLWSDWRNDAVPAPLAPFEIWKRIRKPSTPDLDRAAFAEMIGPIIEQSIAATASIGEMNAELQASLRHAKLLCLTDAPGNMLMWAHYGQQHQGAVLRFSRAGDNNAFQMAKPVRYARAMPRFGDSATLARMITGRLRDAKELSEIQIYTKAMEWRYEREWRLQLGFGRDPMAPNEDLPFGNELLTGLILGCRMESAKRTELAALALALNPDVEIFVAQPSSRSFDMTIEPWVGGDV